MFVTSSWTVDTKYLSFSVGHRQIAGAQGGPPQLGDEEGGGGVGAGDLEQGGGEAVQHRRVDHQGLGEEVRRNQ